MIEIGKYNTLKVVKEVEFGWYLDGEEFGEILIPGRYVPPTIEVDGELEVFLYNDSEDRLIATTEEPYAIVGEFAFLKVNSVNKIGAFLNWGLPKDLLVPFKEQKVKMEPNKSYLVFVYLDESTNRIAASSYINKFLTEETGDYTVGQEVDIIIGYQSDIGQNVIINKQHFGLVYKSDIFKTLIPGQKTKGYISQIRPDGKIDVSLHKPDGKLVKDLSQVILDKLRDFNGFLPINDKSEPEEIYQMFGESKKSFKKAVGKLYKERKIDFKDGGINLL